jgi:hypothetical protein
MFSKTSDPTSAPAAPSVPRPTAPGSNSARSVLGADLKITGEITSTGSVEVLGEIEGNITANGLIIGQEGLRGFHPACLVGGQGRCDLDRDRDRKRRADRRPVPQAQGLIPWPGPCSAWIAAVSPL